MRLHHPACRALHVKQLGAGHRLLNCGLIATVDIGHLNLHPLHQGTKQTEGIRVDVAHRDDTIAGRNEGQYGGRNRCHATGKTECVFSTFELRQYLFKHANGRV